MRIAATMAAVQHIGASVPSASRRRALFLPVRQRAEKCCERNLLVELRIADSNSRLVRQNRNGFLVGVGEEVGVAAEVSSRRDTPDRREAAKTYVPLSW
jgi:hypothetical protein